jgi:Fe-S-cluster containining protein
MRIPSKYRVNPQESSMNDIRVPGIVKFNCTRCGRCCVSLGKNIRIERKTGGRDYYCREIISNALVMVHIEAPYLPVFREKSDSGDTGGQCPFLVQTPEGCACAVYSTRPLICREFQCCRMRIFSREGISAGTIKGRRSLSTENDSLLKVWDTRIRPLDIGNDGQWDMKVKEILESEGYKVELYR